MLRGAFVLVLVTLSVHFSVEARPAKNTKAMHRHSTASSVAPIDLATGLSLASPKVFRTANNSLLLNNAPVRAWSDGAQLVSQNAFVQIGMAPLALFPVTYLPPSDVGPVVSTNPGTMPSRSANSLSEGKDLSGELFSSPLNQVYCTGEVGFMYGRWSGKGSGDYVGSYVWGQAGNDKFQITAGASFDQWNGDGRSARFRSFGAPR